MSICFRYVLISFALFFRLFHFLACFPTDLDMCMRFLRDLSILPQLLSNLRYSAIGVFPGSIYFIGFILEDIADVVYYLLPICSRCQTCFCFFVFIFFNICCACVSSFVICLMWVSWYSFCYCFVYFALFSASWCDAMLFFRFWCALRFFCREINLSIYFAFDLFIGWSAVFYFIFWVLIFLFFSFVIFFVVHCYVCVRLISSMGFFGVMDWVGGGD